MIAAEPITALPSAREWRGVASERAALVDRILTHLCRRISEITYPARPCDEAADLILAVHIVRHLGSGVPPCEWCEGQVPIRLLRAMAEAEAADGAVQMQNVRRG